MNSSVNTKLSSICYSCKMYYPENLTHCPQCGHVLMTDKIRKPYAIEKIFTFIVVSIVAVVVCIFAATTQWKDSGSSAFGAIETWEYRVDNIQVRSSSSVTADFNWRSSSGSRTNQGVELSFYDDRGYVIATASGAIPDDLSVGEEAAIRLSFRNGGSSRDNFASVSGQLLYYK